VFAGPTAPESANHSGTPWNLSDMHFDGKQYVAEVARARADRSWETHRRRTARLVSERLAPMALVVPPGLSFSWASPAHGHEGVSLSFQRSTRDPDAFSQQLLRISSNQADPDTAAEDIVEQLLAVSPTDWVSTFG
jgi:hypothetical protein